MTNEQVQRHGVVVVHGQGADRKRGEFLAEVTDAIASTLEDEGGKVERSFNLRDGLPTATIEAVPPGGTGVRHRFEFVEAFWDDAFPTPSVQVVYQWAIRKGIEQLVLSVRGWLRIPPAPLSAMTRDPVNHLRGQTLANPADTKIPVPRLVTAAYWVQLLAIRSLLALGFVAGIPILVVLFLLDVLDGTPFIRLWGVWKKVASAIHTLDPFLTKVMGDSERYVEEGMWSASARGVVEGAVIATLGRDDVDDVTIVAHSAGCGVSYDALLQGGRIGDTGLGGKRLTLVTTGSAVNRYYWLSKASRSVSPFTRRFAERPLDARITGGTDPAARERFRWLDIYARFDYVPAGAVRADVVRTAGIDAGQISSKQVINTDSPTGDHFAYFRNRALVVPRINRAICGGNDPWPPPDGAAESWTKLRAGRHLVRVATLQTVRLCAIFLAALHITLLAAWEKYRHFGPVERALERLGDGIERAVQDLPLLEAAWDGDLRLTVGRLVGILGPIVILLAIERIVHAAWYSDL